MKYTLRIEQDDCFESPRDWDNLGTMVCFHSRYNLGDKHSYRDPQEFTLDLWNEYATAKEKRKFILDTCKGNIDKFRNVLANGYTEIDDLFEICVDEFGTPDCFPDSIYILPLFLYDHSGITMNTGGFYCRWDSGQVGYIYVSSEKIKKEGLENKTTEEVLEYLNNEVVIYDQFLTGDVWGYVIEDEDGDHIDSCWGFYGREYCEEEAQAALEYQKSITPQQLELGI